MRIGELLVEQGKLRPGEIERAAAEQAHTGKRLCSLLVSRGLLDFDDAARALSAQKRVPCALSKHLDGRIVEVTSAIPPALARECCALPIGKTRGGELIVCVRDPSPQLLAALQQAAHGEVMMVVAPASRLEALVAASYGGGEGEDFDIELGSIPAVPPLPDMDMLDPSSMRAALTDLDDARVEKDPSQSGQITASPLAMRSPTPPRAQSQARSTLPPVAPTLDQTRLALARAESRDVATDHAIAYMVGRWVAGIVLALRGDAAIGYRGHNAGTIEQLALPRGAVQPAIESKRVSNLGALTDAQPLARALGSPPELVAAPVQVDRHVVAVIAVGAPIHGPSDQEAANLDLGHLAHALGLAYARMLRG